jgi:hypothetical protein
MRILEIERTLNNVVAIIYGFPRRRSADFFFFFHFSRWISSLCDGVKRLTIWRSWSKIRAERDNAFSI